MDEVKPSPPFKRAGSATALFPLGTSSLVAAGKDHQEGGLDREGVEKLQKLNRRMNFEGLDKAGGAVLGAGVSLETATVEVTPSVGHDTHQLAEGLAPVHTQVGAEEAPVVLQALAPANGTSRPDWAWQAEGYDSPPESSEHEEPVSDLTAAPRTPRPGTLPPSTDSWSPDIFLEIPDSLTGQGDDLNKQGSYEYFSKVGSVLGKRSNSLDDDDLEGWEDEQPYKAARMAGGCDASWGSGASVTHRRRQTLYTDAGLIL